MNEKEKGTLGLGTGQKLQLSKSVGGSVQQSMSHGRTKTVRVEVRKTRTFGQTAAPAAEEVKPANTNQFIPKEQQDGDLGALSNAERDARMRALSSAKLEEEKRDPMEGYRKTGKRVDEVEKPAPAPRHAPKEEVFTPSAVALKAKAERLAVPDAPGRKFTEEENTSLNKGRRSERGGEARRQRKLSLSQVHMLENEDRLRSMAAEKRAREKMRRGSGSHKETEKIIREVTLPETIEVQELANRMAERAVDIIKELMKLGIMVTAGERIDADTAEIIITEFGHKVKRVTEADVEKVLTDEAEDTEKFPRPPVVTVMGHVDHGKTSLLDALRSTDVAAGEAGGITQHIGAYQVTTKAGNRITFLDTPGHEAFTAMRARGAKATDIVILVVAADDGIMPQTIEAINHAKAAQVPIIVAVNKIDKQGADPQRVKNELLSHELVPEEMGGETIVVEVSALKKMGLEKLEEAIMLQAEVLELKADPERKATGVVIESRLDKGRGIVATLLVQKGTVHVGDIVVAGTGVGKSRMLINDKGEQVTEAGPSSPVEVLGLSEMPNAGDPFDVVDNEKQAREITEYRIKRQRDLKLVAEKRMSLEQMFTQASGGDAAQRELAIIIKGDVQGSVEAVGASLTKLSNEEVKVKVVHSAVGGITESDVSLAQAVGALIIAFNVRANVQAKELAAKEKVDIRYYSIIYNAVDDIKLAIGGMMAPTIREEYLGTARIQQIFKMSKYGKVAGCMVSDGVIRRGAHVRLIRDNVVIHQGKLKTLKRFKDDVAEVKEGFECGMAFENYEDMRDGDNIEAFLMVEEQRTL